ncbi:MAG: hypothetical protein PGMFKBFP_03005 [Anaerolineales bacterium]|nr:hypothetical protein [Anaerolineales bacterium]
MLFGCFSNSTSAEPACRDAASTPAGMMKIVEARRPSNSSCASSRVVRTGRTAVERSSSSTICRETTVFASSATNTRMRGSSFPLGVPPASRKVNTSGMTMKNSNSDAPAKRRMTSFLMMAKILFMGNSVSFVFNGKFHFNAKVCKGRGNFYFCARFFFPKSATETANKTAPMTSKAVIGRASCASPPPRASVTNPSSAQAFGVILLTS